MIVIFWSSLDNTYINTALTRPTVSFGSDPEIVGRQKRECRDEDYYIGCNKIVGGTLSRNGGSRVDFEAQKWIRSSKHPDEFPEELKNLILKKKELSHEYFDGASYGFREARLNVGEIVHMLGVVKEEVHASFGKILVLHPFKAKHLFKQTCEDDLKNEKTNPILRNLLEEDFKEVGSRIIISRSDDDGNAWNLREYEAPKAGYPLYSGYVDGASKTEEGKVHHDVCKVHPKEVENCCT